MKLYTCTYTVIDKKIKEKFWGFRFYPGQLQAGKVFDHPPSIDAEALIAERLTYVHGKSRIAINLWRGNEKKKKGMSFIPSLPPSFNILLQVYSRQIRVSIHSSNTLNHVKVLGCNPKGLPLGPPTLPESIFVYRTDNVESPFCSPYPTHKSISHPLSLFSRMCVYVLAVFGLHREEGEEIGTKWKLSKRGSGRRQRERDGCWEPIGR